MQRQVTAQLIDVSDATQLFDLENVLDYIFQQAFVDPKRRSVAWWEECTSVCFKGSHAVQELLVRRRKHPLVALRLIIGTWFPSFSPF